MHDHKKPLTLLLLFAAVLMLRTPARAAGAAWEHDRFYLLHAQECTMDGGSYHINGEAGYITVCRSPLDDDACDCLLNERRIEVYCTWPDGHGTLWGQLRYNSTGRGLAFCEEDGESVGWVRMSELVPVYDERRFLTDHLAEFTQETVSLDTREYESVGVWAFPGCGGKSVPASWYMRSELEPVLNFPAVWRDSLGRRWGSCQFESARGYICIDFPELRDNRLSEIEIGYLSIPAADAEHLPAVSDRAEELPIWLWPAASTAICVLAAAVMEIKIAKEKKHG